MPYIPIALWDTAVNQHQKIYRTIHEIHAACYPKYTIDEIEEFLLHNAISAFELLEHCKTMGRFPDAEDHAIKP